MFHHNIHAMSNEHSTTSSYYLIYRTSDSDNSFFNQRPISRAVKPESERLKSKVHIEDRSDVQSTPLWEPDEWTDLELAQIQQLLEENVEKCDILVGSSSKTHGETEIQQFEEKSQENWNKFYQRHQSKFFKDRHYLIQEFPHELGCLCPMKEECLDLAHDQDFVIAEIGCGVGNAILPLLELNPYTSACKSSRFQNHRVVVWAMDFSPTAVDILKTDDRFIHASKQGRAFTKVWDITNQPPPIRNAHISLLLFCLSSISPEKMISAAINVAETLQPGGYLLLRDYGRFDEAQVKLGTSSKRGLGNNFYVKHDGTRCYYFTIEDLERLFVHNAGLKKVEIKYIHRKYTNRAHGTVRRRIWIEARLQKPQLKNSIKS